MPRSTFTGETRRAADIQSDIVYPSAVPFVLVHLACFAAFWSGVTWQAVLLGVLLYWGRIFAIGAGYHRYFAHRSYATSRAFQLVLAVAAQSTTQKSVMWWAAKHRHHHLYSDTEDDFHSPRHAGFIYSHLGWIFSRRHDSFDTVKVADLTRYPELMWLHRHERLPGVVLAILCWLIAGWSGLIVGFFWSTVAVYHATFAINSLAHVSGSQRYVTGDDSRNNWLLALFTMGEGWHNNHHACQSSVRQGFRWWEVDPTFYVLTMLSWIGVVWDLKKPPRAILRNEQRLGSRVIDRAARQLARSFDPDGLAQKVMVGPDGRYCASLLQRLGAAREQIADVLAMAQLPQLPTRAEIGARARTMFAASPSLDDIIDRAHRMVLEMIGLRLSREEGHA